MSWPGMVVHTGRRISVSWKAAFYIVPGQSEIESEALSEKAKIIITTTTNNSLIK